MTNITKHNAYAHIEGQVICGVLTTEHSASSYNLPVFVVNDGIYIGGDDWSGRVIGSNECDAVSLMLDIDLFGEDTGAFESRIREAGYAIQA